MKRNLVLLAVAICLPGFPAHSQDATSKESAEQAPPTVKDEIKAALQDVESKSDSGSDSDIMKKWKEYSSPGDKHKALDRLVGKWSTTTKVWPEGPTSTPSESTGTSNLKWILGKRHLQQESQGTMLGMKVSSVGFFGYDNFKKKYTSTWMESTSTARYTAEGTMDRTGKVITMHGRMDEFLTGEHDKVVRYELTMVSADVFTFKIFDLGLGKDNLVVEVKYTRVKEQD